MVVGFDVEPAQADGQQPGPERVGVQFGVDVGGMHDPRQADEGGVVARAEVVDEHFEGAATVAMVELGAGGIEAVRILVAATARTSSVGT